MSDIEAKTSTTTSSIELMLAGYRTEFFTKQARNCIRTGGILCLPLSLPLFLCRLRASFLLLSLGSYVWRNLLSTRLSYLV